ncbi:hypothetical protein [Actinomadura flavalba]|uniref:hypothetical protein n=1 Tax=Actinomadura flavalba TaxID=1120938 RepID=UPI00035EDB4A|nr:hypothetical protein [Actinomadura flavalba]
MTMTPVRPEQSAVRRRLTVRTVPGRIRTGVAVLLVLVGLLTVALAAAVGNARSGVQAIGHDAGPQVVVTGDLYFALSAMDAQVADILLTGRGAGRDAAARRYDQFRGQAGAAAVQAAQLAGDDPERLRTVREVLDGLGRYQRLAGEAMLLARQSGYAAGEPTREVVATYRRASDLMKIELLPKAYNVALDSGATVRQAYETRRSEVLSGRNWVLGTGALVLLALVAAQVYLARDFRRTLNPALALATVLALALTGAGFLMLSAQADDLREAKEGGFDSVLALSRARAISHSAFADQSRFLLDPGRADTYAQTYLDKSQTVLYVEPGEGEPGNLATYYKGLERIVDAYPRGTFLGFFGDEARLASPSVRARLAGVLTAYRDVQRDDRRIRDLVARGDRAEAVSLRMSRGTSGATARFDAYDRAVVALREAHAHRMRTAVRGGDDGLRGWEWIPPVAALAAAVLVLAGVRPRLAEFR